ncbi:MAG: glycosyltransferase [Actinomycetota bacterium]
MPADGADGGRSRVLTGLGVAALCVAVVLVARSIRAEDLARVWSSVRAAPFSVGVVLTLYSVAFLMRAWIWTKVLPGLSLGHSLAAIHVSLAGNHVLPLRLGEALRVTNVVSRTGVTPISATVSTVMLRAADVLAVVALGAAFGPRLVGDFVGGWGPIIAAAAAGLWALGIRWMRSLKEREGIEMSTRTSLVAVVALLGWVLESAVIWQAAHWAGIGISVQDAILVTAVTIAAQVVAIAPGGLGTYEAAATAMLVALGAEPGAALACALAAHALKTVYSLATGAVALFVPAPGTFGRFRLPSPIPAPRAPEVRAEGVRPVVLFMPAHNEEASVGSVVARVPERVSDHPVLCMVIDDGSTDATAAVARSAGATVVSLPRNRGLGAAVRRGLAEAVACEAEAVAFCDADNEYLPEELEVMVGPILEGRADYVVGSRFAGEIQRMARHRRLGNLILTRMLRFVSRRPITDGQSGYRAFSRSAAEDAEIIHDFNYAQVLTLDLLAKGYRYEEVPITYRFRTTGRSFVRLGRYLRRVLPAIHRELNAVSTRRAVSILDDVLPEPLPRPRPVRIVE